MSLKLPSASGLKRALECPASQALPRAYSKGPWAERGDGVHDFIVRARLVGRDAAIDELDPDAPHYALCANLPLERMPQGGRLEAAFAWNWRTRTARFLGVMIDRNYDRFEILPEEFVGTLDLEGQVGDLAVLIDWKSGFRWLGPPESAPQLLFGALVSTAVRGLQDARVSFWYMRDNGSFYEDVAVLGPMELENFADELEAMVPRIERARATVAEGKIPTVSEGQWCDYCPAMASCPAKVTLARAMLTEPELLERQLGTLTHENAGRVYERIKQFEDIAKRIKDAIRGLATVAPVPLSGGKSLREVPWPATILKADVVHRVIAQRYGQDVADKACPREASQSGIQKAIGEPVAKAGGKVAPAVRELLELIEQERGLVVLRRPQVREGK